MLIFKCSLKLHWFLLFNNVVFNIFLIKNIMISIVVAMSLNRVIGNNNSLPWNVPEDLKNFKKITSGKTVIMWYKTYQSIWFPLKNRKNIILSKENIKIEWCYIFFSMQEIIDYINQSDDSEIMVIWWESVYTQFIERNLIDKIYLSLIPQVVDWDKYFPMFEDKFKLVSEDTRQWYIFREYLRK